MHLQFWQWAIGLVEFGASFHLVWAAVGRWEVRRSKDKLLRHATLEQLLLENRKKQADQLAKVRELQAKVDRFNRPQNDGLHPTTGYYPQHWMKGKEAMAPMVAVLKATWYMYQDFDPYWDS